jgi:hypothetical protein
MGKGELAQTSHLLASHTTRVTGMRVCYYAIGVSKASSSWAKCSNLSVDQVRTVYAGGGGLLLQRHGDVSGVCVLGHRLGTNNRTRRSRRRDIPLTLP